jgi:hypothetical protein
MNNSFLFLNCQRIRRAFFGSLIAIAALFATVHVRDMRFFILVPAEDGGAELDAVAAGNAKFLVD